MKQFIEEKKLARTNVALYKLKQAKPLRIVYSNTNQAKLKNKLNQNLNNN